MRVNPAARCRASPRAQPCPRRAPRLRARRPGKKSGVTTPASAAPARSIRNVTTSRREEGRYLALWLGNTPTAGAFFFGRNGSHVLRNPHAPRVRRAARLQVVRREDCPEGHARHHRHRGSEWMRQEQHLGVGALGTRRAEREGAPRPAHGGPDLPRLRVTEAGRIRRGRADLQQRRRALGAVDRGGSESPALPNGRERVFPQQEPVPDRKSTRLNSSHLVISYAVFCLKKKSTHSSSSRRCNTDPLGLKRPHTR